MNYQSNFRMKQRPIFVKKLTVKTRTLTFHGSVVAYMYVTAPRYTNAEGPILWSGVHLSVCPFLPARPYASAVYAVIARPSVCPSVRPDRSRCSSEMAKPGITQTTLYDSAGTQVFWCQRSRRNSNGVTPNEGAKWRCCGFKSAVFDQYFVISQKRYKIGTEVVWKASRNSYVLYPMSLFSVTLVAP